MNLTIEHKVILYLLRNIEYSKINRTLIFKLLFLSDYYFYLKFNRKITQYEYCKYDYGPFSPAIYSDLERLEYLGIISCKKYHVVDYIECKYKIEKDIDFLIDNDIRNCLDLVSEIGNKISLNKILDLVYSLNIVKETQSGEVINFKAKEDSKIENLKVTKKYKILAEKMKLTSSEDLSEELSNEMLKEYFDWSDSVKSINKEILSE